MQALIAARLDTLPADRKSLLQDAAVVGKVFWAGALAAMGDRDPSDVTQALHELARKELVRPVRASSMAGEQEYTFWHALVRDVCYAQIPRLRAPPATRPPPPGSSARGERVADLADVLAYHYLAALELHEAAGDREQEADAAGARRAVARAGWCPCPRPRRRASGATAGTSPGARARDAPERASLLEDWARRYSSRAGCARRAMRWSRPSRCAATARNGSRSGVS